MLEPFRVLVFEYITGGGMANTPVSPALSYAGDLMLNALLSDLSDSSGVEVVTTRDHRLGPPATQGTVYYVHSGDEFRGIWESLLQEVDAVWPVAPETDGILEQLSTDVIESGTALLNSRPEAVRTAASKCSTARLLRAHGIPVVDTWPLSSVLPAAVERWVVKPDDGVGCDGLRLLDGGKRECEWFKTSLEGRNYVAQPYVDGFATSLSILCRDGDACVLSANEQRVAQIEGVFRLQGCVVGSDRVACEHYVSLATEIAAALPGLWGYVGVDLIESVAGPQVLEVNPRLTISYAGLRRCLATNPASMVLDLLDLAKPLHASPSAIHSAHIELENTLAG